MLTLPTQASHLTSRLLEYVLVANFGHMPNRVNFSCRIARSARARDPAKGEKPVDIIASLKG